MSYPMPFFRKYIAPTESQYPASVLRMAVNSCLNGEVNDKFQFLVKQTIDKYVETFVDKDFHLLVVNDDELSVIARGLYSYFGFEPSTDCVHMMYALLEALRKVDDIFVKETDNETTPLPKK